MKSITFIAVAALAVAFLVSSADANLSFRDTVLAPTKRAFESVKQHRLNGANLRAGLKYKTSELAGKLKARHILSSITKSNIVREYANGPRAPRLNPAMAFQSAFQRLIGTYRQSHTRARILSIAKQVQTSSIQSQMNSLQTLNPPPDCDILVFSNCGQEMVECGNQAGTDITSVCICLQSFFECADKGKCVWPELTNEICPQIAGVPGCRVSACGTGTSTTTTTPTPTPLPSTSTTPAPSGGTCDAGKAATCSNAYSQCSTSLSGANALSGLCECTRTYAKCLAGIGCMGTEIGNAMCGAWKQVMDQQAGSLNCPLEECSRGGPAPSGSVNPSSTPTSGTGGTGGTPSCSTCDGSGLKTCKSWNGKSFYAPCQLIETEMLKSMTEITSPLKEAGLTCDPTKLQSAVCDMGAVILDCANYGNEDILLTASLQFCRNVLKNACGATQAMIDTMCTAQAGGPLSDEPAPSGGSDLPVGAPGEVRCSSCSAVIEKTCGFAAAVSLPQGACEFLPTVFSEFQKELQLTAGCDPAATKDFACRALIKEMSAECGSSFTNSGDCQKAVDSCTKLPSEAKYEICAAQSGSTSSAPRPPPNEAGTCSPCTFSGMCAGLSGANVASGQCGKVEFLAKEIQAMLSKHAGCSTTSDLTKINEVACYAAAADISAPTVCRTQYQPEICMSHCTTVLGSCGNTPPAGVCEAIGTDSNCYSGGLPDTSAPLATGLPNVNETVSSEAGFIPDGTSKACVEAFAKLEGAKCGERLHESAASAAAAESSAADFCAATGCAGIIKNFRDTCLSDPAFQNSVIAKEIKPLLFATSQALRLCENKDGHSCMAYLFNLHNVNFEALDSTATQADMAQICHPCLPRVLQMIDALEVADEQEGGDLGTASSTGTVSKEERAKERKAFERMCLRRKNPTTGTLEYCLPYINSIEGQLEHNLVNPTEAQIENSNKLFCEDSCLRRFVANSINDEGTAEEKKAFADFMDFLCIKSDGSEPKYCRTFFESDDILGQCETDFKTINSLTHTVCNPGCSTQSAAVFGSAGCCVGSYLKLVESMVVNEGGTVAQATEQKTAFTKLMTKCGGKDPNGVGACQPKKFVKASTRIGGVSAAQFNKDESIKEAFKGDIQKKTGTSKNNIRNVAATDSSSGGTRLLQTNSGVAVSYELGVQDDSQASAALNALDTDTSAESGLSATEKAVVAANPEAVPVVDSSVTPSANQAGGSAGTLVVSLFTIALCLIVALF